MPDVFSAGDCAAVPDLSKDDPGPATSPSAQHAVRQAKVLADNVVAHLRGKPLKHYEHSYAGSVASLGLYKGVAEIYGIKLRGFVAWFMHRTYHVSRMPTWNRRHPDRRRLDRRAVLRPRGGGARPDHEPEGGVQPGRGRREAAGPRHAGAGTGVHRPQGRLTPHHTQQGRTHSPTRAHSEHDSRRLALPPPRSRSPCARVGLWVCASCGLGASRQGLVRP